MSEEQEQEQEQGNIYFLLEEEKDIENIEEQCNDLEQIMSFLNDNDNDNLLYFKNMHFYNNNGLFYNTFTIKELMKICKYYKISKYITTANYKKQYIIDTIICYESQNTNYEIVEKRHRIWSFMTEIMNDKYMKKTVIWN